MNLFLVLGIIFIAVFVLGFFLEKIRVPWIFAALIVGLLFAFNNPVPDITNSDPFLIFSQVGLYLLLFLIGFELNFDQIKKQGLFIIKATFFIEFLELLLIGLFIHFVFSVSWFISFLVALSFATVGEAVLLPILDEFRLTKTKLGQTILGIATFDDTIEILVILLLIGAGPFLISRELSINFSLGYLLISLSLLVGLVILIPLIRKIPQEKALMSIPNVAAILPLLLSILFIFIGIGRGAGIDISVLGALLAGITAKNLLPQKRVAEVEPQVKFITYGLFAPIFFFNVGLETNPGYLLNNFFLVIILVILAKFAKISGSLLIGRNKLGLHKSLFMGVALGVRFSTSIVILKLLYDSHLIKDDLFSILIGTSIVFKFIIPFVLSFLIKKWPKIAENTSQ